MIKLTKKKKFDNQGYKPKPKYILKKKKFINYNPNVSNKNKYFKNLSFNKFFYLSFYPTPSNLTNFWNFGFLSFFFLIIQIITGIFLSMHYVPNPEVAFENLSDIMRNVQLGWTLRYMHSNGASFFFALVYLHMARTLFNCSFAGKKKSVWVLGVLIYYLMIITAFTGYVLPWGQMSFWAATVITNLVSVVPFFGPYLVKWLWGGYAVGSGTLNRFLSVHFTLPFIILALVIFHVVILHFQGSSNRLHLNYFTDKVKFGPYYFIKDFLSLLIILMIYFAVVGFCPNYLSHPDNFVKANPLVTPEHIVPEWYFLPFYAILRSVPNKTLGIMLLIASVLILLIFPYFINIKSFKFVSDLDSKLFLFENSKKKKSFFKIILWKFWKYRMIILFWYFVDVVVMLGIIGANPIEYPYYGAGQLFTFLYFLYFFLLVIFFDSRYFKEKN